MTGDMSLFMKNMVREQYPKKVLDNAFFSVVSFLVNLHKREYYHNDIKTDNILYSVNQYGDYEFAVGDYGLVDTKAQLGSIKTPWRFTDVDESIEFFHKFYGSTNPIFGEFDEQIYKQMYSAWSKYNTKSESYQHLEDYFATHITFKSIFNNNHMYYKFDDVLLNPEQHFISDSVYRQNPNYYLDWYKNPPQQGGTRNTKIVLSKLKKEYIVRKDKIGKYIIQNRTKVYLSSIKGTYRYIQSQ
jgi:hypothetical protein